MSARSGRWRRELLSHYLLYGFSVRSEIGLPVAPIVCPDETAPAWVFRLGKPGRAVPEPDGPAVATMRDPSGARMAVWYQGKGGDWIWNRAIGMFHIHSDYRQVDVYPEACHDERALGLLLVGQISIFLLRRLGYPSIHASAVLTPYGAVAFLGSHGQGKSTLASCFLRRGAALLADDALPLRIDECGIYGGPSVPMMKLWRDSVERALALSEELPNLMADVEKKLLSLGGRYPFHQQPARLCALYGLRRYDPVAAGRSDVVVAELGPKESLMLLLDQTSWKALIPPVEAARLLPLYTQLVAQTPVRLLAFPHGYQYHDAVHARINEDLQQQ
jgi:hypothetical protein